MQISIYLQPDIVKLIDQQAKKRSKSRSHLIQSVLKKIFLKKKNQNAFEEIFGSLTPQEGESLLQEIRQDRLDSPRFQ